jgi:hypothetical protein
MCSKENESNASPASTAVSSPYTCKESTFLTEDNISYVAPWQISLENLAAFGT